MTLDPEAELETLFGRLVGKGKPKPRRSPGARTLFTKVLQKEHLIEQVRRSISIELPQIGKSLKANFGYKNGCYNVIEPVDFTTEGTWFKVASARAVEGQALRRADHHSLGPMKLVIVGRFAGRTEEHSSAVRKILSDHQVDLYEFDRIGPLIDDIREHVVS